jgi:inositol phosphorylceramide mannosyltransferase catalytic subunit
MASFVRWNIRKCTIVLTLMGITFTIIHQLSYLELDDVTDTINLLERCDAEKTTQLDDDEIPMHRSIQNTIHQIWKTANTDTYSSKASCEFWKDNFGPLNYTVTLWTDRDIRRLIESEYTWLLSTYTGYTQDIQRADLARLVVVHARGGIYADLDVFPKDSGSIDCLRRSGIQAIFSSTSGNSGFSNHFFMAEKGSMFLYETLRTAKQRGGSHYKRILLPYLQVFWSTGPMMVTAAFWQYWILRDAPSSEVALLNHGFTKTMVGHAAGRSWHSADGVFFNEFADHIKEIEIWVVWSVMAVTLGIVFVKMVRLLKRGIPMRRK